jgi:hypothetical protein
VLRLRAALGVNSVYALPMAKRKEKPQSSSDDIVATDPASVAFVRALIARGEACPADADGKLPPGATHEIVGETADGVPILRRRRFSAG